MNEAPLSPMQHFTSRVALPHIPPRPPQTPPLPRLRRQPHESFSTITPPPAAIQPAHHQTPPTSSSDRPSPAAASEPRNRPAMPELHKRPQERPITDRSGQQYPGEIAAGGPEAPEGLPGAKTQDAWGRALNRKPHAKTREDAVAVVIEANHELMPPSCSPPFCH